MIPGVSRKFEAFAWFSLAYTLLVILWGAWVRISGSGDGCGTSWPTCHGEIIPTQAETSTLIEFFHRATSGLLVFILIGLLIWAFRAFAPGSGARRGAWATFIFVIIECAIGAVLVINALVGNDDSIQRAIIMAFHLVNTCLLTGAMLLTIWWSRDDAPMRLSMSELTGRLFIGAMIVITLINATGAVTALGDTLYPISVDPGTGFVERLEVATFSTTNIVIQMRVLHPFIAVAGSLYLLVVAGLYALHNRRHPRIPFWAGATAAVILVQVVAGFVNILLGAPGWMQLVHLGLAKLVWLVLLWLCFYVLKERARVVRNEESFGSWDAPEGRDPHIEARA